MWVKNKRVETMLGIKVELKDAEKAKNFILSNDLMDKEYYHVKDKSHICFAVKQKFSSNKFKFEFVDMKFPKSNVKGSLKDNLSKLLSDKEMEFVKTSHDTIGSIAIIEVPKDLVKKEKLIAETLLKINPQIKTVLKKAAIHGGVYRTQKLKFLAGVNTKETIYKENGVQINLDVEKVYFSIRLSNERKRVAEQIKKGEEILVLFSGCAPYPLVLAKNSQAKKIVGVEINPVGHKYGIKSLKLNHLDNITLINSDVKKFTKEIHKKTKKAKTSKTKKKTKPAKNSIPEIPKKYDRILMPAPHDAHKFLNDTLKFAKKGTIIHYYDFLELNKVDVALNQIAKACKKSKLKHKVLDVVKCGQHSPYVYRICVDFKIV